MLKNFRLKITGDLKIPFYGTYRTLAIMAFVKN